MNNSTEGEYFYVCLCVCVRASPRRILGLHVKYFDLNPCTASRFIGGGKLKERLECRIGRVIFALVRFRAEILGGCRREIIYF